MATKNAPENEHMQVVADAVIVPPTRDEIRAKIFLDRAPEKKTIQFFGQDIELRQPLLGDIVKLREGDDAENRVAVIETLVAYAYIPGTDIKVFEEADADTFKTMPFGKDFTRVMEAVQELTGVNFRRREE